jgi:uncharacterized protein (TIGR00369 family)
MAAERDVGDELRDRMAGSAFYGWAGLDLVRAEPGEVELAFVAGPHHLNLQGLVHGGMLATLADTATGFAIRTMLDPGRRHATVQLDVRYLAPGGPGRIVARGRVVQLGSSLAYAEADVVDEAGTLLAKGQATHALGRSPDARDA